METQAYEFRPSITPTMKFGPLLNLKLILGSRITQHNCKESNKEPSNYAEARQTLSY